MEPVRVGIVGCGVMGMMHARVAAELSQTELVAVADGVMERAQDAAEQFGVLEVYADGSELVADVAVELVVLALPTSGRTALALAAFEHGKHVLTEKPVAMNAAEVQEMIAARGDLKAACCSSRFRFLHSAQVAAEYVASGALGDVRVVHHRNFIPAGPPPEQPRPEWRLSRRLNGGGILMNWGCYDLDYLLGICGWKLKPQTVLAQTWPVPGHLASHVPGGSDGEAHYAALVRCEGGQVLSVERGEYMAAAKHDAWQIIGERGSLRLTMLPAKPMQVLADESTEEAGMQSRVLWEDQEEAEAPIRGPLVDLAETIRGGGEPLTNLERALVVQKVSDAVYQSAASGEVVRVG